MQRYLVVHVIKHRTKAWRRGLAAYGLALKQAGGNGAKARELVGKFFANMPVPDSGARGSTLTFAERGIGDVLLSTTAAWST